MNIGDEVVIIAHRGDRRLHSAKVDFGQKGKIAIIYSNSGTDDNNLEIYFTDEDMASYGQTVRASTVLVIKDITNLEKAIYGLE